MSFSRILFYADDVGQANRLALLLSRYGHEPVPAHGHDLLHLPANLKGAMLDCRRMTAECRVLALSVAARALPVVLFADVVAEEIHGILLDGGVTLVPHRVQSREPLEAWLRQARAQQAMLARQQQAVQEMSQKLEERKLVERAKGVLMKRHQLDEEAAYRALRTSAMKHGLPLGELARRLLQMGS